MIALTLQLDWKPNAQFAGVLWAHHHGEYRQAGIELTIIPWQSHTNPVDALISDQNIIASTEDNLLIRARGVGRPVKAIGTMMQFSGIGWMALEAAGLRHIQDFKGKRIGIHGDGETALKIALQQAGLSQHDVEIVDVGFNYGELLTTGQFDAVQCFVMVEPLELQQEMLALQVIPAYESGYQVYSQVLATTERLIAAEPEALTRFLKVTFDGWRAALEQPAEAGRIVADHYLPEADPLLQRQMLEAMEVCLVGDVGRAGMGSMTATRWAQSIHYLLSAGIISQPLEPEQVMTTHLLDAIR